MGTEVFATLPGWPPPCFYEEFDFSNSANLICAADAALCRHPHALWSSLPAKTKPGSRVGKSCWISGSMQNLSFPYVPSPGASHIISWKPSWSLSLTEREKKNGRELRLHSAVPCLFGPFSGIVCLLFPAVLDLGYF